MDHGGASEGPGQGRAYSSSSAMTSMGATGQSAQSSQRPKVKITPFHSSPIVHSGTLHSKRPGAASGKLLASPGSVFLAKPGHLTAPPIRERLAAVAAAPRSSKNQTPNSGSEPATTGEKAQEGPLAKVSTYCEPLKS